MHTTIEAWMYQFPFRDVAHKIAGKDIEEECSLSDPSCLGNIVRELEGFRGDDGYFVFFESIQPRVPLDKLKEKVECCDTPKEVIGGLEYYGDECVVLSALKNIESLALCADHIDLSTDRVYHAIIDAPYHAETVTSDDFSTYSVYPDSSEGIYFIERPHHLERPHHIVEMIDKYKVGVPFWSRVEHGVQVLDRKVRDGARHRLEVLDRKVRDGLY